MKTLVTAPVQRATPEEERQVLAAIALAFSADPVVRWIYPEPDKFLQHFSDILRMHAHVAFEQGAAYYTEAYSGAALWFAPGADVDEDATGHFLQNTVSIERQATVFTAFEKLERFHPGESYWYLPFIGVEPAHQRKGYGGALMAHALEVCDREEQPAFLEATSPDNVRLYQRHGFEVVGIVQEGEMPPLYPMVRLPGGASARAGR